ncbi:MAG: twin-arginine translocase TatA/TatE family subunit [Bacteroidota bacterium]|jgi:sec-independent protein translocase protein TatA|nr:twin-arginine translocase TatA/TatE family subunit [Bacteroidota bacterium]
MLNSVLIGFLGLGGTEVIVILVIVLLLFGGKKIPELMKGLGRGIKDFKDASKGTDGENNTPATPEKKD